MKMELIPWSLYLYSFLALFIEMPKTGEGKTAQNSLMGYGLVIAKQFMPQTHLVSVGG